MALLAMNGFEDYGDSTDMEADDYVHINGPMTLGTGRIAGQSLIIDSFGDDWWQTLTTPSGSTWFVGFGIKFNTAPSSSSAFVYTYNTSGTEEIRIYITTSGTIQVRRVSTILGTTVGTVSTGAWNHMVLKVFQDNATGTVELWLNGTKELDLTSQDTLASVASIATFQFAAVSASVPMEVDDFYFGDTTGTDMTDEQGDCQIEMLTPDANGTTNNFTASPAVSNYLNVDDGATPDDDTTYNHSSTATHKELYTCSNIVGNVDTIHAVQVRAYARKEDAGNRLINLICRNSTTEVDSGQKGLTTTYGYKSHIYENDPDGGGNWTEADVNAIEVGLEIGT
jgi:hypothetical protein